MERELGAAKSRLVGLEATQRTLTLKKKKELSAALQRYIETEQALQNARLTLRVRGPYEAYEVSRKSNKMPIICYFVLYKSQRFGAGDDFCVFWDLFLDFTGGNRENSYSFQLYDVFWS